MANPLSEVVYEVMSADDVESRTIDAVLDAVPDGWAKVDGEWMSAARDVQRFVSALEKIARSDYRGNMPPEVQIAQEALGWRL